MQIAQYPRDAGLLPMTGHGVPERASAYTGAAGSWMCHIYSGVFGNNINTSELKMSVKILSQIPQSKLMYYLLESFTFMKVSWILKN